MATAVPTSPALAQGAAPSHVLTADYVGGYAGTRAVSWSAAASYLNWAETSVPDASAMASAGIKTIDYTDTDRIAPGDPLFSADESLFAHTCDGQRIYRDYSATTRQYLADPTSTSLTNALNGWITSQFGGGHFDALFDDDAASVYGMNAMPCNYSPSNWTQATAAEFGRINASIIFNNLTNDSLALADLPNVTGGEVEECYARSSNPTAPYTSGDFWTQNENLELAMARKSKLFFCYNNDTESSSSPQGQAIRLYTYASFLLSYDPRTSLLWEYFATPSAFHVQPETGLVATAPLGAAPGDISGLQTAGGAYAREYAACYIAGQPTGPCAAVVNPDPNAAHAFPLTGYSRTMTMNGGGVLDGGTIAASGAAPPASLAPMSAVIAFK